MVKISFVNSISIVNKSNIIKNSGLQLLADTLQTFYFYISLFKIILCLLFHDSFTLFGFCTMKWKLFIFIHYATYDCIYWINIYYLNSHLSAFHCKTPQMTSKTFF